MKKLMVAIAAAATALGLYATQGGDPGFKSGTGFDAMTVGAKTLEDLDAGDNAQETGGTWSQADGVGAEVKAWVSSEKLGEDYRPDQYGNNITQANYLWVTNSLEKPLTRTMTGDAMSLATADAYVDTLVKFTACDEEITTLGDAEAKIAVWVREDQEAGTTNLMITAGKILAEDGSVQQQNYDCGSFDGVDAWHRLTIKAIGNIAKSDIGLVGFVVFIDGNVTGTAKFSTADKGYDGYKTILNDVATLWDKNGQLFPSLRGKADGSISALAVAGQGGIDDIAFTATAPEWANKAAATITWDPATVAWVSIDDGETKLTTGSLVIEANKLVTITAEAVENYMITNGTGDWMPAAGGTQTVEASKIAATVEIGGVTTTYADLAQAISEINGAAGKAKLTLGDSMAGFVLETLETAEVTIDLNGKTITAAEGNYGIWDEGFGSLIIIDPIGGGVVDGTAGNGSVGSSLGGVTLNAGTFKGAASSVTTVANGVKGDVAAKDTIDLSSSTTQQWTKDAEGDLYTVTEKQIKTFKIMVVVNGETVQEEDVEEDAEFTPETPTLKGWQKLDGWKDGAGADVEFPVTVTAAATYTAQTSLNLTKDDDAYQIGTAAELQILQAYVADAQDTTGLTFKQTGTINLAGIAWGGIGTYVDVNSADNRLFCGVYNGNNETIENVTFAKKNYNGLFGNLGGAAQVKNLTIEVVGFDPNDTTTQSYGFGAAAGYAMGTDVLLENITVNPAGDGQASICGTHNMAGIGARLAGKITLKDCVNNLDISTTYSKIGGMCAIASQRDETGAIEFNGCVNNGTITGVGCTETDVQAGSDGLAGILGYIQDGSKTEPKAGKKSLSIINCENNGTLQHTGDEGETKSAIASFLSKAEGGGLTIVTLSGNKAKADYAAVYNFTDSGVNPDGLNFATVDGGIATFIADADVAKGTATSIPEFKVMTKYAAWSDTAFKNGDAITFDRTLFTTWTATVTDGTNPVEPDTSVEGKITYKLAAQQGWPEDPTEWNGKKASEQIPALAGTDLANADAGVIAKWAKGKGSVDFSAASSISTEAFLLDIANDSDADAIKAAKDAFKITAITIGSDGTVTITGPEEADYNGKVTIEGKKTLDATWGPKADDDQFFRATLTVKEVPAE